MKTLLQTLSLLALVGCLKPGEGVDPIAGPAAGEILAHLAVVADDGASRAERTVVLWNPPLLDAELGLRGSALAEAAKLQAAFVERGLRTLTFAKSRKAAELILRSRPNAYQGHHWAVSWVAPPTPARLRATSHWVMRTALLQRGDRSRWRRTGVVR